VSRSRLEALAYRMLGSFADAEDVVQDARLRLLRQSEAPENEDAWLFRVVTNLSLDRLRARKRQRETYPGPWLPDPLPDESPEGVAELAEQLSIGLVMMLERLSPAERAVFVLREAFELSFDEIAGIVDASSESCRQRYRRARGHLSGEERFHAPPAEQRALLEQLLGAVAAQDYEQVVALFAEDCIAYADGGGVVTAAIRPVTQPGRLAQVTLHLAKKLRAEAGVMEFRWMSMNGGPAVLIVVDGEISSTLQVDVADGLIKRLYIVRNPDKLRHLTAQP